jgi:tetratricopeptide (TPR) repeat protein
LILTRAADKIAIKNMGREMNRLNPIKRERDRKVVEIVRNFLLAVRTFRSQHEKYGKGSLRFSDLAKLVDDRGESILFCLKENCHSLFRRNESSASEKEQLFDLAVGTLFHLAMKMREDLYQLEFYGPTYSNLSAKGDGSRERQSLVRQFEGLISRARHSFREDMDQMATLLQEVLSQFRDLLDEYRTNGLLIRFFMEERELLQDVLGPDALEDLFQRLYGSEQTAPYWLAGESYFQSGFYERAAQAFSQALEKSPEDKKLRFIHHLSQGLIQFYSFAPHQALKSLENCISLAAPKELVENYQDMIFMICEKIQEEFPGRRKGDQHRDLTKKAKALQRQVEKLCLLPPTPRLLPPQK